MLFYPVFRILFISYALLVVMIFIPHPYNFTHIVYITWQDFRAKHVRTYVCYIVFRIFLLYI